MDRRELLDDEQEALRMAMDGRLSSLWTAIPGIIQSVDLAKMTVTVQPSIQGQIQNPDQSYSFVNYPLLVDVPIVFPSGGGFILTFPLVAGDEVLVIFSARCIDSWWQNGGIGVPMEFRLHDLSDGFAIPGPKSQPNVVPTISAENVVLRDTAGDTLFELKPDGTARIKATLTTVEGDMTITGNLIVQGEMTGLMNLAITMAITAASLAITGLMEGSGDLELAGNITANDGNFGGKDFVGHVHSGVQVGGGNTGGPV